MWCGVHLSIDIRSLQDSAGLEPLGQSGAIKRAGSGTFLVTRYWALVNCSPESNALLRLKKIVWHQSSKEEFGVSLLVGH